MTLTMGKQEEFGYRGNWLYSSPRQQPPLRTIYDSNFISTHCRSMDPAESEEISRILATLQSGAPPSPLRATHDDEFDMAILDPIREPEVNLQDFMDISQRTLPVQSPSPPSSAGAVATAVATATSPTTTLCKQEPLSPPGSAGPSTSGFSQWTFSPTATTTAAAVNSADVAPSSDDQSSSPYSYVTNESTSPWSPSRGSPMLTGTQAYTSSTPPPPQPQQQQQAGVPGATAPGPERRGRRRGRYPSGDEGLSQAEITKRERRREQNRRAAEKCRLKKRDQDNRTMKEYKELQETNNTLKKDIEKAMQSRERLEKLLEEHMAICPLAKQTITTVPSTFASSFATGTAPTSAQQQQEPFSTVEAEQLIELTTAAASTTAEPFTTAGLSTSAQPFTTTSLSTTTQPFTSAALAASAQPFTTAAASTSAQLIASAQQVLMTAVPLTTADLASSSSLASMEPHSPQYKSSP